jgi:hypothetical protein
VLHGACFVLVLVLGVYFHLLCFVSIFCFNCLTKLYAYLNTCMSICQILFLTIYAST